MKCLIVVPHIFEPKKGSLYSSQDESKREAKTKALREATIGNLNRHNKNHWVHASLGKGKKVVTRKIEKRRNIELNVEVYTNSAASLVDTLPKDPQLKIIEVETKNLMNVPKLASRSAIERWDEYDMVGYMEDDIKIEDADFFQKIKFFHENLPVEYAVLPHRCEYIPGKGDVILSGDPDGGRKDLFWDTNESVGIKWPTGNKEIYRATNPHSGCFFISKEQAKRVFKTWSSRNWTDPFELSGPLEQAASGRLIETLKVMKPRPEDYQFFMVRHLDTLWKRHVFEE